MERTKGDRRVKTGETERIVREMVREEIMGALEKMKSGKAAGMDGIVVKMLKMDVLT